MLIMLFVFLLHQIECGNKKGGYFLPPGLRCGSVETCRNAEHFLTGAGEDIRPGAGMSKAVIYGNCNP